MQSRRNSLSLFGEKNISRAAVGAASLATPLLASVVVWAEERRADGMAVAVAGMLGASVLEEGRADERRREAILVVAGISGTAVGLYCSCWLFPFRAPRLTAVAVTAERLLSAGVAVAGRMEREAVGRELPEVEAL